MFNRVLPIFVAMAVAVPGASGSAAEFRLLSRTLIEGPAHTVSFSANAVLLGTGCGVAVFHEGDSLENPSFVPLGGDANEIVLNGTLAYVAVFGGGLEVIDLGGSGPPREAYRHAGIQAISCALAGGSLFVADSQNRLFAFDLANPREPRLKETKRLPFGVVSLAGEGNILTVAHRQTVAIYRAGPGGAFEKLSEATVATGAKRHVLRRGILYVVTGEGEVLRWNIDKAGNPSPLEPLPIKDVTDIAVGDKGGLALTELQFVVPFEIERAAGSATGEARARISSGKGFAIASVNSYGQPIATGNPSAPQQDKATRVFIAGDRCAVVSPFDGLRIYALEKGGAKLLGAFETRGFAINLLPAHGLLYVANGFDGVRIGRITPNGAVDWIGHIQTLEARDIALSGTNLVIADGQGGLKIADVSDPGNPRIIGGRPSPYFMSAVAVARGRAYCAGGLGGVEIIDISQPRRPSLVWRQDFTEVRGITVDDRYLYFTDGNEGMRIYSLTKQKPVPLSVLDTPGWNCDCFVDKNTAYLADGGAGIVIADVGNRKHPRTLGSLSLNTLTRVVWVFDKTLFAAGHTKGVAAVDVSNPKKPAIAAWYDTADDGRGVFADEQFVYAASGSGGVYIFKYLR
jgi:hypothetical protein